VLCLAAWAVKEPWVVKIMYIVQKKMKEKKKNYFYHSTSDDYKSESLELLLEGLRGKIIPRTIELVALEH
jgi:hypothetical protein